MPRILLLLNAWLEALDPDHLQRDMPKFDRLRTSAEQLDDSTTHLLVHTCSRDRGRHRWGSRWKEDPSQAWSSAGKISVETAVNGTYSLGLSRIKLQHLQRRGTPVKMQRFRHEMTMNT